MGQIIELKTRKQAQEAAENLNAKIQEVSNEQKSVFEKLLNEIDNVNPELGGFEELGALLALPDEHFGVIAPIFLDQLQKSLNNVDDKLLLVQAMNLNNTKLEDFRDVFMQINEQIDNQFKDVISPVKRDFLKQMMGLTYNCIAEAEGVAKTVINVPVEFTSEYAQMPTYAHLGDGAMDLYAPEDVVLNPGDRKIIPIDIKTALPYGYAFLIHPRSGMSAKTSLRIANSIGLVDPQYRGVIGVIVENIEPKIKDIEYDFNEDGSIKIKSIVHGQSYTISKGDRFAQMRLVEVPTANLLKVDTVANIGDDRNGGFGSTGK